MLARWPTRASAGWFSEWRTAARSRGRSPSGSPTVAPSSPSRIRASESRKACASSRAAEPLMEARGGGAIMTMTYLGGERAVPHYNVMGVAKAALDASVRYLAWDLGQKGIRINAISAGTGTTLYVDSGYHAMGM